MDFVIGLILLALLFVCVTRPYWGLFFIIVWNFLGGKEAAYLNVVLGGVPLFITEVAILGLFIGLVRHVAGAWPDYRKALLKPNRWVYFYGTAGLSALRGAGTFPLTQIVRDLALIYYSIFKHFCQVFFTSYRQVVLLALVLSFGVAAIVCINIFTGRFIRFGPLGEATGSSAMIAGFFVVGSFFTMPLWWKRSKWWCALLVLVFAEFMFYRVRSAWLGFGAAYALFLVSFIYLKFPKKFLAVSLGVIVAGASLSLLLPNYIIDSKGILKKWIDQGFFLGRLLYPDPQRAAEDYEGLAAVPPPSEIPMDLGAPSDVSAVAVQAAGGRGDGSPVRGRPVSTSVTAPAAASISQEQLKEKGLLGKDVLAKAIPQKYGPTQAPLAPSLPLSSQTPFPVPEEPAYVIRDSVVNNPIVKEINTLFMGMESPNLKTRLYLWVDALEKLFSVRFPFFAENYRFAHTWFTPRRRRRLEGYIGPIILGQEAEGRFNYMLVNSKILKAFTGVPFGEKFVPSRIHWWMLGPGRYDPHNSHLAILFRTGILGFALHLFIFGSVFWSGLLFVKRSKQFELQCAMLTVTACLLYHFSYSMTAVALENSYKGMPYWVCMGLVGAIQQIAKKNQALEKS